jgi:hypothetical protein
VGEAEWATIAEPQHVAAGLERLLFKEPSPEGDVGTQGL